MAKTLRGELARQDKSKTALAKAVGLSVPQISQYLSGNKRFDVEELDALCWALGLDSNKLYEDADRATRERHLSSDWKVKRL